MLKMEVHLDTEGRVLLSLDDSAELSMVIQLSRQAAEALSVQLKAACTRAESVEALFGDVAAIFEPGGPVG